MPDLTIDHAVVRQENDQTIIDATISDIAVGGVIVTLPKGAFAALPKGAVVTLPKDEFSMVTVCSTTRPVHVYQPDNGQNGLSKFWLPDHPPQGPVIKALIPRDTVVAIGLRAERTQWYLAETWGVTKGMRRPPSHWRICHEAGW
jgi:hypothetical protein